MCVLQVAGGLLSAAGGGSIVLLSSIRSQVVEPGQGVYAATKAGIAQLARTAAAELGAAGVRVNALAPGVIDTPLTKPIQQNEAWNRAYAGKTALGPLGKVRRDRQRGGVPGLRRVELHDRRGPSSSTAAGPRSTAGSIPPGLNGCGQDARVPRGKCGLVAGRVDSAPR